jgi:single-strand DNA-binding protein
MNFMVLIGNVGRDPEIRTTTGGTQVANFSIATSEKWKDKDGDKVEKTTWHNCVVWGPLVKVVEGYVEKGTKLAVAGRLEKRKWTDRDDNERENVEINVTQLEILSWQGKHKAKASDGLDDDEDRPRKSKPKPKTGYGQKDALDDDLDDPIPW